MGQDTLAYMVFFKDKPINPHWDCREWLSEKAIERRIQHGLPCHDPSDLPLNQDYVRAVSECVVSTRFELRWFNALTVNATSDQVAAIQSFPFVTDVAPLLLVFPTLTELDNAEKDSLYTAKLDNVLRLSRQQMGFDSLQKMGLDGKGIRIAIFDAGFKDVDNHPAFQHIRDQGRILITWDFQRNKADVYGTSTHGTSVLSCIAGKYNGKWMGAAPEAEFLLARTEKLLSEKPNEEDYWMAAAEWAEKEGAQIISSSLGYTHRYEWQNDLTGQKALVTRAAAIAVRKGILVVNSLGNEGSKKNHFLGAPADADSVIAVGATYPMVPYILPFSSYGPNARGIMKPDICAPGYILAAAGKGKYKLKAGTSFSCPMVSGFAACLMQANPSANSWQIRDQIRESGHLYPYFDYRYGYGVAGIRPKIPQDSLKCDLKITYSQDTLLFSIPAAAVVGDSTNEKFSRILYYETVLPNGYLSNFQSAIIRSQAKTFKVPIQGKSKSQLRVWFDGCLYETKWE